METQTVLHISGPTRADWTLIALPRRHLQDVIFDQDLPGGFRVAHTQQAMMNPAATVVIAGRVTVILNAPVIVALDRANMDQAHIAELQRHLFPVDRG